MPACAAESIASSLRARNRRGTRRELCVERIEPRVGDCFFLPAGVLHALGPGLLVAEIQQASDTTYRLYDWNRLGPDGQPRELHVAPGARSDRLSSTARCRRKRRKPRFDRKSSGSWRATNSCSTAGGFSEAGSVGGDQRCHILIVVEGAIEIEGDPGPSPLARGGVVLLPAELGPVTVRATTPAVALDAYLP